MLYFPRLAWDWIPSTYSFPTAGIRAVSHDVHYICYDGFQLTFFPGWPQTMILLISAS
jgi:hypothetical protein